MKNKHVLIITGGYFSTAFAREYVKEQNFDTVIAVDRGLAYALELGLYPNYILGDFDSVPGEVLLQYHNSLDKDNLVEFIKLKPEKDETDTQIAIELAIKLEAEEIVLLGATGKRIDHLLANIHLLSLTLNYNMKAYIVDEYNKLYLINKNTSLRKEELYGTYVSLVPFTDVVGGVTLEGFKYPLHKKDLYMGVSLGISNEVMADKADIIFESGILIITESKD
ncbi:MAG: thiamine pyrophosphokinae [Anaerocolumna sp.]|jgi:thiamine pyrophosphokinase|nr:thiamine pyrophosphokinae [Anaerocolumna sp.]